MTAVVIGYAGALCSLGVILCAGNGRMYNVHAGVILLIVFGVFVYRNVYPLVFLNGEPIDNHTPWLMYTRGILVTITGLVIPGLIPHEYVPVDPEHPSPEPNPEQTASLWSFITFTFMEPIVMIAYRNSDLPYDSLPPLADYDRSAHLEKSSIVALDPITRHQKGLNDRHLFFGLMQIFFWEYVFFGCNLLLDVLSRFMAPYALKRILQAWIVVLLVGGAFSSFFRQLYIFVAERAQVRAENILLQQIFRHALRLRVSDTSQSHSKPQSSEASSSSVVAEDENLPPLTLIGSETATANIAETVASGTIEPLDGPAENPPSPSPHFSGQINTLIGADVPNILGARDFLVLFVMLPFQTIISTWFLFDILGWSAIIGMVFMVAMMPIPGLLAKRINDVEVAKMQKTEARIQGITESVNIIRMIKMFGWEGMIAGKLYKLRADELSSTRKAKFLELFGGVMNNLMPVLILIVTFSFHTLVMHKSLDAAIIFSSIAVLDLLRLDLGSVPFFITSIMQAKVSLDRLTKFLRESPLLDKFSNSGNSMDMLDERPASSEIIGFKNVNLSWVNQASDDDATHQNFTLKIDSVTFDKGSLNLVTGPTGCGKTSLLLALLGEMHIESTGRDSWVAFPRHLGVAYAAQEAWVQNTTIKKNIVFLEPYDEERYKEVLRQCALERDLALLSAGDQTEVGEKGITLSGGQKARIALARAIYSSANIIVLDDVLSALDVHTSSWIVANCFRGDLVAGRTIIIATHAIDLVAPLASRLFNISRTGEIRSLVQVPGFQTTAHENDVRDPSEEEEPVEHKRFHSAMPKEAGKLILEEDLETGRLRWSAVELLINTFGGYVTLALIIGTCLLVYISSVIGTWWLGVWARAYETSSDRNIPILFYLGIFVAICGLDAGFYALSSLAYLYGSLRVSSTLHEALSKRILGAPLRWLDVTPVGRIISRFTQDIGTVDGPLITYLHMFISFSLSMLIQFGAILILAPWFSIPGIFIGIVGVLMGQIYISARLPVRRLISKWQSPLYTHFSATIDGIISIRAYGGEAVFRQELFKRLDEYTRPCRTFHNLDRWVAVRSDVLGAVFTSGLAFYLVYLRSPLGPSNSGVSLQSFCLNMALRFSGLLLFWVRLLSEVETAGNSVERIRDYLLIEQEPPSCEAQPPPAYWPASGSLQVHNLQARYSEEGPKVLKNVSFEVKSGERIGIVGRTGSGKSSLALSLLRLIPTTGEVEFDGILTRNIRLDTLRQNMAIIPQDPSLLSGNLRSNLDPVGEHDDVALNSALRAVGLIGQSGGGKHNGCNLDTAVASSGSNFSVGQRQLIALARAMVRGTKVLILDEATASVDAETDQLIQRSIRKELKGTTLLTIAHRLQTIMDYDKILVMESGELVEFGSPLSLLERNSMFRALVEGSADAQHLLRLARESSVIA
ncbi:P-loop containing nucleoside triphosphate hydrolase protein [Dacryopinax primogenitus]|uniref:p-loop containing nucleoside triphosphate hydrolase protein n=1 Tax=Dacryopinax primogenitus (strain DJM 731) TaxID=1858805 RepID=M5GEH7_DACPD|nr:P-loop containing nucleoside triphosphate hydrolase protein [Dacryopinax primogenitus]EJU03263.1 P-loop containing nucleoside triphosphate hydrolase protein [Dacryopinax primogenitus]